VPKFLESKLQERYGAASDVPYKIMNKLGYMKGNQETAKGQQAEEKHERDQKKGGFARSGIKG
jgi:hypothetical protein